MSSTSHSPRPKARSSTNSRIAVSRRVLNRSFRPIEVQGREYPDYPGMAIRYCEELVEGRVPACQYEVQAGRRFLNMLKEARSGRTAYGFSVSHVVDVCSFMELLPHVKGYSGQVELEPVQCWWLAAIFGFRERETGFRWIREVSLWIPRKNGKTLLSVGMALYCANCEGEKGAEVTISAGSENQANIPYDALRAMLDVEPALREAYGAHDTRDFTEFRKTGAIINIATSRAKNLDGYNPHMILAEELHAQSQEVIGVLRTAQAARRNPLNVSISTAGRDVGSAAYTDWLHTLSVLAGKVRADRVFAVIYAATKDD